MKIRYDRVSASDLTTGTEIYVPMTEAVETVADVRLSHGYATVATVEGSRFQWASDERVTTPIVLEDDA